MHFTSMPDAQHQYVKFSVVYVVDDPVVADPNPKFPVTAPELNTPLWTRFLGQSTDRVAHRGSSAANLSDEVLVSDLFGLITRRGGRSNISLILQCLQSTIIELRRHNDSTTARPARGDLDGLALRSGNVVTLLIAELG